MKHFIYLSPNVITLWVSHKFSKQINCMITTRILYEYFQFRSKASWCGKNKNFNKIQIIGVVKVVWVEYSDDWGNSSKQKICAFQIDLRMRSVELNWINKLFTLLVMTLVQLAQPFHLSKWYGFGIQKNEPYVSYVSSRTMRHTQSEQWHQVESP